MTFSNHQCKEMRTGAFGALDQGVEVYRLQQIALDEELPDAVTRLLIERGAVLTVVEEDPEDG